MLPFGLMRLREALHKLRSHNAAVSLFWEANYKQGEPVTFDAETAEMINTVLADIRELLSQDMDE